MNFTHLHVHTEYSLLDGSSKVGELVARAKELGMDSLAITDHGVMYGVINFYEAAKKAGIKPILGCEVYVAPGSRFDKDAGVGEDKYYHLVLLAENNKGYDNLMKLVSVGFTEGYYYKPRVDYETLEKYSEGIIALSACLAGEVPRYLARGMYEMAVEAAKRYEKIFGKGNFFLELQDHGLSDQAYVNPQLVRMSNELGIDLVCTNDAHYINAQDWEAHDVLLCIQTNKKVDDEDRLRYTGGQYYLKSPEEMAALFPYAPQALENTYRIAQRCNVEIEFGVTKLPHFAVPEGYTSWTYLNYLCLMGLKKRYPEKTTDIDIEKCMDYARSLDVPDREDVQLTYVTDDDDLLQRLNYELSVIHSMGFVDYFLIVWDYVNYAKTHGVAVGPGRGSAAGSLVSYALTITDIDPIKYSLIFERFLNPERVSMPDIDVDFSDDGRQMVIDYVVDKYGRECVSQIITFGTMAARAAIKDVGRVLDMPYAVMDNLAKMIPRELDITIDKALEMNPDFREAYESDAQIKRLVDMAKKLEGLPRHSSIHASGVLISGRPVGEYVPLSRGADGENVAQFEKDTLEHLGLLKMDFLGLRTETVLSDTEKLARRKNPDFSINSISYEDASVYELIASGKCVGIFQLESSGMRNFMKELKPDCFEDVIAGISLYRPGPMAYIPQYEEGKNNPDKVTYDCPQLEPILKPTYGVIVYQEQVMQIVRDLAGYSLGRSDMVRRAMAKKKHDVMEKERQNFIYGNEAEGIPGCISRGVSEKTGNEIYDKMISFAAYAFNKSHAAGYAVVCYQTAFLKKYYPVEYMSSLLTSVIDNSAKVEGYIYECRQMGIDILSPDVNRSELGFTDENGAIRFGLSAIRALGRPTIEAIIENREANGAFKTMQDFAERMHRELNKRTFENLIKAGALDSLGSNRRQMMSVYIQVLDNADRHCKDSISGQMSLFDIVDESAREEFTIKLPNMTEYNKEEMLEYEKEVLGVYVSGHPLDEYVDLLEKNVTASSKDFEFDDTLGRASVADKSNQVIGGMVREKRVMTTKNGNLMAVLTMEDNHGTVEVTVFPKDYNNNRRAIDSSDKLLVKGHVQVNADENGKLICDRVVPFAEVPRKLWIRLPDEKAFEDSREYLLSCFGEQGGIDSGLIYCEKENERHNWPADRKIHITTQMIDGLRAKYGKNNVAVTYKKV